MIPGIFNIDSVGTKPTWRIGKKLL